MEDIKSTMQEELETNKEDMNEVQASEEVSALNDEGKAEENKVEAPEVIETMSDYEDEINASLKKIRNGDVVEGEIIGVNDKEVLVSFGYVSDGIIPASEMPLNPEQKPNEKYNVGDKVKAEVIRTDDGSGNVELSINKAAVVEGWQVIEKAFKEKELVEIKVVQAIKGGVLCQFMGMKGFMPASLSSAYYIEDLNELVGKTFDVQVIELEKNTNRVVFSRKELEREQLKEDREKLFETIKHGDTFTGNIKKIMDFGVFVNIGSVDGLVRTEDLSWEHITDAKSIVSEGQEVEVYVLEVDRPKKKIRLGMKDRSKDPWNTVEQDYTVGEMYDGKVMRMKDFGAFVALETGIEGLVHLSQISDKHIKSPEEVLKVGDEVKVRVLEINKAEKRIRLSMKSSNNATSSPRQPRESRRNQNYQRKENNVSVASNNEAMTSLQSAFDNINLKDFKN